MSLLFADLRNSAIEAEKIAKRTFLKGLFFTSQIETDPKSCIMTSVGWDPEPEDPISLLNVNPNDPMAAFLIFEGVAPIDAWLLVFAHESGHLYLNDQCHKMGLHPKYANSQLKAIGFSDEQIKKTNDSHKETAIEAYCDAILARETILLLGPTIGFEIIQKIAMLREEFSDQLGPFAVDEYATAPALFKIAAEQIIIMPPKDAAEFCLTTLSNSFKGKMTALSSPFIRIANNLTQMRQMKFTISNHQDSDAPPAQKDSQVVNKKNL